MNIFKNSRFAVSLIFAINGMVFGTWASRIPAIVDFHDLSPGSLGLLIFLAGLSAVIAFSVLVGLLISMELPLSPKEPPFFLSRLH